MRRTLIIGFAGMLLGFMAFSTLPATAATTTSTTQQCIRSSVQVVSPITVQNMTATVSFRLLNGCHLPIGLASYTNTGPKYDPQHVADEKLFDSVTGHYADDGQVHTLTVKIPNCYYEVDFFFGDLIPQFSTTNQYLGELVAAVNAGTTSCTNVLGESVTRTTAPATVSPASVSTSATTQTTAPTQVLGEQISAGTLPNTGVNVTPIVLLGFALLAIGLTFRAAALQLAEQRTK